MTDNTLRHQLRLALAVETVRMLLANLHLIHSIPREDFSLPIKQAEAFLALADTEWSEQP